MLKRIIIGLVAAVVVLVFVSLWLNFVTLGRRPWNDRAYTKNEIWNIAQRDSLVAQWNCYLLDLRDLKSEEQDPQDQSITLPLYRVFDREGHLLRQHCCFESIPGFVDSTARDAHWSQAESEERLRDFVSHLRTLDHNQSPSLDYADTTVDYYVLYYWDTTTGYNINKFRSFLQRYRSLPWRCRVIAINYNTISDRDSLDSAS